MRTFICTLVAASIAVISPVGPAFGQEASTGDRPPASASPRDGASVSAYKSRIFQVKNRRPDQLVNALRALGSGAPNTEISPSNELGTISVRDFPENIATIGEAIERLDVPEGPRDDVEIHLHVLIASRGATTPSADLPQEIRNAVAQLQNTLAYTSFSLLAPIVQRASADGSERSGATSSGQLTSTSPGAELPYSYRIERISRATDTSGASRVNLGLFRFDLGGSLGTATIASNLSLRDGEQVVVGTAMLRNGQALVLVVSARSAK